MIDTNGWEKTPQSNFDSEELKINIENRSYMYDGKENLYYS